MPLSGSCVQPSAAASTAATGSQRAAAVKQVGPRISGKTVGRIVDDRVAEPAEYSGATVPAAVDPE